MQPVTEVQCIRFNLKGLGAKMPRDRHQNGWVEETGKKVKKWKGHYYIYLRQPDGTEKRKHRSAMLGLKSQMRKWEAERELGRIIERETDGNGPAKPDGAVTFEWFWKNRYLPIQEARWRRSTRDAVLYAINSHALPCFGNSPLCELTRFDLQTDLNKLAKQYSRSVVDKVKVWVKAALDEAVEQDYLGKNPARKLEMPPTRPTSKRYLSPEEIQRLLPLAGRRDRLILRLFLLCALRPGELFALRWRGKEPGRLQITEAIYRGKLGDPKTEGSKGCVALSQSLDAELEMWRCECGDPGPDQFIFRSLRGTPIHPHNYLRRVLQPLARKAGIEGVNYQDLRRTFATQVHGVGTVKDAQTQLRHTNASTTMNIYTQAIPASVRAAVEALDQKLCGVLNTNEHKYEM